MHVQTCIHDDGGYSLRFTAVVFVNSLVAFVPSWLTLLSRLHALPSSLARTLSYPFTSPPIGDTPAFGNTIAN